MASPHSCFGGFDGDEIRGRSSLRLRDLILEDLGRHTLTDQLDAKNILPVDLARRLLRHGQTDGDSTAGADEQQPLLHSLGQGCCHRLHALELVV